MALVIKFRVVKRTAKEWHDVMASRTPPGRLHIAIALKGDLSGLAHTEEVRRVVERTEVMSTVEPGLVGVLVTLQAVVIHHQGASWDKIAGGRSRERRLEIFLAFLRTLPIPHPRVLRV